MSESLSTGSDSYYDFSDNCTFQRSLSVPASCRKNGNHKQVEENGTLSIGDNWNNEQKYVHMRRNKTWYRNGKFFLGRKSDVRVSRINPDRVKLPSETLHRLQDNGNDFPRDDKLTKRKLNHQTAVSTSEPAARHFDKTKCQNSNGLVKILQDSVRRISSLSEKHGPSSYVIKTVELVRHKEERLGIFIKKRKIPKMKENDSIKHGIFVTRLDSSCQAARLSLLKTGDQVLAINAVPLVDPDVKEVAVMMCVPKHLILTVRTSQKNGYSNGKLRPNISSSTNSYSAVKSTVSNVKMAALPEESAVTSPNSHFNTDRHNIQNTVMLADASNSCKSNTLSSVYDNDRPETNNSADSSAMARNSVFVKFDESYQILLNAIACCDKPDNVNGTSISTHPTSFGNTSTSQQSDLPSNFAAHDSKISVVDSELTSHFGANWVNETMSSLSTNTFIVNHSKTASSAKVDDQQSVHKNVHQQMADIPSTSANAESSAYSHTVIRMIDEPDYDDVPTSDVESNSLSGCSCNGEELNVDAFVHDLQNSSLVNGSCKKNASVSSSSSSVSSCSMDLQQVFHSRESSFESETKRFGFMKRSFSDAAGEPPKTLQMSTPKFPVAHTDLTSTTNCNISSCINQPAGITVDKKRQWLNKGQQVSDELQMRLEGLTVQLKQRDNSNSRTFPDKNVPNGNLGHVNGVESSKANSKRFPKSSVKRRTSESSVSSGISSSSPGISRTDTNLTDSLATGNELAHCKSPTEKSAKTVFSIGSPTTMKQFPFPDASNSAGSQSTSKTSTSITKTSDSKITFADGYPSSKQTSAATLPTENAEETINRSKTSESSKLTSPSRSRKRNWSKKITKKFKIGSSENTVSDYTCWNAEEEPADNNVTSFAATSKVSTQHNIQRRIDKGDSAVLNRYHLDISMAHQRRISRQLLLDNAAHDPSVKQLTLSQFRKHKPLPVSNSQFLPAVDGCLVITLYGVRELKKTLCEAYCLVQVDTASTKRIGTTMQTCRGAVAWNQCFEMTVSKARDLHLTLYTWETRGGKHKMSSCATLNLPTLFQNRKPGTSFAERLAIRLEPRGTLYVKVALEENPSSPGPLVFGADLQSIVDREAAGLCVPNLVHSCIEEVEKRGMQVVGIYRLCGSAIVKKDLRRKLEEAQTETPLNAENYPDVNVITGILKDFLRELPQPLFPPELLEAVTAAMEKNPGPTPAVVVKEPFAPDPCLTSQALDVAAARTDACQKERTDALLQHIKQLSAAPAERATLYALLNHLKKVAMHSSQNKMTCQNLAVCFGPVLLGPVNAGQGNGIDLSAAIGFKRHIQVLNYMLSNWPDVPVEVPDLPSNHLNNLAEEENRHSANRMSCVSLTRRLSRVFVVEENEVCDESEVSTNGVGKRGTLVSMGRRESLDSILETTDQFADPELDMFKANPPEAGKT